jgi:4-amino-4-deoxy-L-arabinose transferase-like glycosyltransferase
MTLSFHQRFVESLKQPIVQYTLLALITLLAGVLRFYRLGEWSFWIDEVWSVEESLALDFSESGLVKLHSLFPLLLKPALVSQGVNEWSARLVPVLVGILTIPILYLIVKRMVGARTAILSALLLTVAPWHIYWSQNARYYTLLLLLYTLSLFIFYWGLEKDQFRYLALSVLLWAVAIVVHPTAIILVCVIVVYLLLLKLLPFSEPPGFRLKNLLPFLLLPLFYGAFDLVRAASMDTVPTAGESDWRITFILAHFFAGKLSLHALRLLLGVIFYLGIPLTCMSLLGGLYLLLKKNRSALLLSLGALVPLLMLLVPVSQTRYVFLALPCWIILGALAVTHIFTHTEKQQWVLALGLLIILVADPIVQDLQYFKYQNGHRWNWKDAFAMVEARKEEGDLVVTTWPELGTYYLQEDVIPMYQTDPEAVVQHNKRVWFVDDGWINPNLYDWLEKNAQLIDILDVHLPGKVYPMRVYLYDPGPAYHGKSLYTATNSQENMAVDEHFPDD